MRRTLAVLAISGLVAAAAGAAATVDVDAGTLQYGTASVSCDESVDVNWGLENNDGKVYFVRVADIAPECNGADVFVTVVDSAGASLFEGQGTPLNGQVKISIPGQISAEQVAGVEVGIEGGAGAV
jgi:hypothetical protein